MIGYFNFECDKQSFFLDVYVYKFLIKAMNLYKYMYTYIWVFVFRSKFEPIRISSQFNTSIFMIISIPLNILYI